MVLTGVGRKDSLQIWFTVPKGRPSGILDITLTLKNNLVSFYMISELIV